MVLGKISINNIIHHIDTDGNVVYELPLPGFTKDNLEVNLIGDHVYVKGERTILDGSIQNINFDLFVGDTNKVCGTMENGIMYLTISLDKMKKISIS